MFNAAQTYLRTLLGPQADFRRNQWEAIDALAEVSARIKAGTVTSTARSAQSTE